MPRTSDINHVPGVYASVCCGIERSIPDNMKIPPCPGGGKCAGQNDSWTYMRRGAAR
jgi:hypothetical protein